MMRLLKNNLNFATIERMVAKERNFQPSDDPEKWLRRGIQDLDFDPVYFLATGETSPEGWAVSMIK